MNLFQLLYETNTSALHKEIINKPELWNQRPERCVGESPHREASDMWIRYNDIQRLNDPTRNFHEEHIPIWYPAYFALKEQIDPLIFGLMRRVNGEVLGGVLITKVPARKKIYPHVDKSWHVDYYDKFYIQLAGAAGCEFCSEDDEGQVQKNTPLKDQVHLFDNRFKHWVNNDSDVDRMTLIVCIRTQMFGRV
jgi:hypothetical protein